LVDEETYKKRLESCNGCDRRIDKPEGSYCGACGCGMWAGAKLDNKLKVPYLTCPLRKPGFSNA
jgi:hypothetical protein